MRASYQRKKERENKWKIEFEEELSLWLESHDPLANDTSVSQFPDIGTKYNYEFGSLHTYEGQSSMNIYRTLKPNDVRYLPEGAFLDFRTEKCFLLFHPVKEEPRITEICKFIRKQDNCQLCFFMNPHINCRQNNRNFRVDHESRDVHQSSIQIMTNIIEASLGGILSIECITRIAKML